MIPKLISGVPVEVEFLGRCAVLAHPGRSQASCTMRAGQGQNKAAGELGQVWTQTKQPACIEYRAAVSAPAN